MVVISGFVELLTSGILLAQLGLLDLLEDGAPRISVRDRIKVIVSLWGIFLLFVILYTPLYRGVLVPYGLTYLSTLLFVLVVYCETKLLAIGFQRWLPHLLESVGDPIPIISSQSLQFMLFMLLNEMQLPFLQLLGIICLLCLGVVCFTVVMYHVRKRLQLAPIPVLFRGMPINLLMASLLAMVMNLFTGILIP